MRSWTWLLCGLAAMVLATGPALAADAPKDAPKVEAATPASPEAAKKAAIEGELAVMVKECKLSDEQQKKLLAAVNLAQTDLQAWEKANADKLEIFKKALAAAVAARDQAAYAKAYNDNKAMLEENRALGVKFQKTVLAILTPEQQATWQGFLLFTELSEAMKRVNATDEQKGKLRPLCDAAGKDLVAVKDETEVGAKARQDIVNKLLESVKASILTEEQRKMLTPPPGAVPGMPGAAPAAPATPAAPAAPATPPAAAK